MPSNPPETVRVDKWLWAARFYKTRSLASAAVNGGKVHLNGQRIKPARTIKPGDILHIQRDLSDFEITVLVLSEKRGPARVAQTLYEESVDSIRRREEAASMRKYERLSRAPQHRPDKRSRRQLRELQRGKN